MKLLHLAAACALTLSAATASAQGYPNRPVKVIVPFATGAASDIIVQPIHRRLADVDQIS